MEDISVEKITKILKELDPSSQFHSILAKYPSQDNLSIFFTDSNGVFTQRIVKFPEETITDHPFDSANDQEQKS